MSVQIQNSTVTLLIHWSRIFFFLQSNQGWSFSKSILRRRDEYMAWKWVLAFFEDTPKKNVLKIGPKKKVEIKRYLFDRMIVSKFSKYVFLNWCWLQYFIECQIETPSLYCCCCGWFKVTELPICSPNSKPQKSWEMGSKSRQSKDHPAPLP